jgi:hypothetical protein
VNHAWIPTDEKVRLITHLINQVEIVTKPAFPNWTRDMPDRRRGSKPTIPHEPDETA